MSGRGRRPLKAAGRQASLFGLAGVLVNPADDAKVLNDPDALDSRKLSILRRLASKRPTADVLAKSGLGKAVKQLTKHGSVPVAEEAKHIYDAWRVLVERKEELAARGPLEVACDDGTRLQRNATRRLILAALQRADSALGRQEGKTLADRLEKAVFDQHGHVIAKGYKRCARRLAEKVDDPEVLLRLYENEVSARRLVEECKDR